MYIVCGFCLSGCSSLLRRRRPGVKERWWQNILGNPVSLNIKTSCAIVCSCKCIVDTFMRSFTPKPKRGVYVLPFDLSDLPRAKKISTGQKVANIVQCKALKNVKGAELQSIQDGFEKVFEDICSDMTSDQLPKEVLDKSSA